MTPEPDSSSFTHQQAVAWLRSLPPHHWNFQITGPQIADIIERLANERDASLADAQRSAMIIGMCPVDAVCKAVTVVDQARRGA